MWLWAKFKGVVYLACRKIMWYIAANQHFSPFEGLSWAGFLNPAHCYINYKIQCLLETFHFFVQDKLWFSSLFGSSYFDCKNCKFSVFCNCWDTLIHSSEDPLSGDWSNLLFPTRESLTWHQLLKGPQSRIFVHHPLVLSLLPTENIQHQSDSWCQIQKW